MQSSSTYNPDHWLRNLTLAAGIGRYLIIRLLTQVFATCASFIRKG
jgi:hypothetical protein